MQPLKSRKEKSLNIIFDMIAYVIIENVFFLKYRDS